MRAATLLPLLLCLTLSTLAAQVWVPLHPGAAPDTPPRVTVTASTPAATTLEVLVPGFWVETTPHGARIRLADRLVATDEGRPELPFVGCNLALPRPGVPSLAVVAADWARPGTWRVRMAPKLETDRQLHTPPAPKAPGKPYPESACAVVHTGRWRQVPAATVQVHPFRATGDGLVLEVARRLTVRVAHPAGPAFWPEVALDRELAAQLRTLFVNGSHVPVGAGGSEAPATEYLVLGPAGLLPAAQPLVDWRRQQGWATEVVTLATKDPATIKGYIQTRFQAGKLKWVLMVGEYADIPTYNWSGNRSESWYAALTGGSSPDLYPDVGLGRLSGSTPAQITHQVNKILKYEKNPAPGSWHDKIVLTAHGESGLTGRFTSCAETIANGPLKSSGWTTIKQYGYLSSVTNTTLTSHINQGAGIVFYRGHGSTTSWSGWCPSSFTNTNVAGLANGGATPVVFSICCTTGYFQSGTCYTEQWLRTQYGAIACLGATNVSYTSGNTPMAIEFCRAIFQDRSTRIADFHVKGITKALQVGGYGGQMAAYLFCWMGDSATRIWFKAPRTLTVTHPASVTTTSGTMPVTVLVGTAPLKDARVCLAQGTRMQVVGTTNASGQISLPLSNLTAGNLTLTVTAPDHLPYQKTLAVTGPFWTVIPAGLTQTEGDTRLAVPSRYAPSRSQNLYDATLLKGLLNGHIKSLALRRDGLDATPYVAHKFVFDVGISTRGVPAAGRWDRTSYRANRGTNHTTALSRYTVSFPAALAPAPAPAPFTVKLPLTTPVPYQAGNNLLVEFNVDDSPGGRGDYLWYADAQAYPTATTAWPFGFGCPAGRYPAGGASYAGPLWFEWSSGGGYGAPALGFLGTNVGTWGPYTLPYNLVGLGASGCWLATDFVLGFPGRTEATGIKGRYRVEIPLPANPSLCGAPLFAQIAVHDPGFNALGIRLSPGLMFTMPQPGPALQLTTHGVPTPFPDVPGAHNAAGLILEVGM